MGRIVGVLADCLALARLLVEARGVWRDYRRDGAEAEPGGADERPRPDLAEQAAGGDSSG